MLLKDFASFICLANKEKIKNMRIIVIHDSENLVLWNGRAKDLEYMENIYKYAIMDIMTDYADDLEADDIYKAKTIKVREIKQG